ncbi:MAG: hypothetical protein B9J98_02025 [Candidatus Terraquivivens tikiterensis]|uniref:Uncharacterized protein n=1 Tax=Candidatus Terraquivivens tikiterensis TaxID=1980982 RepID=A0A2R7Y882_9ARCH|nr:MAG: hypothetical protein B9J98_02025 [Candidatus Terraquivivens tikiterensis]
MVAYFAPKVEMNGVGKQKLDERPTYENLKSENITIFGRGSVNNNKPSASRPKDASPNHHGFSGVQVYTVPKPSLRAIQGARGFDKHRTTNVQNDLKVRVYVSGNTQKVLPNLCDNTF